MNKPRYRKISDLLVHPPSLVKNILSDYIWKVDTDKKVLYLTFDDGPIPVVTENILQALSFFDAKATFFCVGENVVRNPKIYERILKNGHSVGNHTYSHLSGLKTDTHEYIENIERASQYIESNLFRPPHGRMKTSQLLELSSHYHIVLWDVLSYDFDNNLNPTQCFDNVQHFSRSGSIIVMHDSIKAQKNMFYTLTQTLSYFSAQGYKFEALEPELFENKHAFLQKEKIKFAV